LLAELCRDGIVFQYSLNARESGGVSVDPRPVLVAVTGTKQKIELMAKITNPGAEGSLFGGYEVFNRIPIEEICGVTGGEIVLDKIGEFGKKLWAVLNETRSDHPHREAVIGNRVFVASDTKIGIGPVGEPYSHYHKLRTELREQGFVLDEKENTVRGDGRNVRMAEKSAFEFLPIWWKWRFEKMLGGSNAAIRWSTGNAALKFLPNKDEKYAGDRVIVYGDSKASLILPYELLVNKHFWQRYLIDGCVKRGGLLSAFYGSSMGILVEDIIELATSDVVIRGFQKIGWEFFNLKMPKLPEGIGQREYLEQHAKGAANDVLRAVLERIVKANKKGIIFVGTRE